MAEMIEKGKKSSMRLKKKLSRVQKEGGNDDADSSEVMLNDYKAQVRFHESREEKYMK